LSDSHVDEREYARLRAEWLRLKNQVYDANAELPTLAAAVDDIRRLIEDRSVVGFLYLDLGGSSRTETAHGWMAHDELLRGFAHALVGLRRDGTLGPRDLILALSVRSDKFLVVAAGSGPVAMDEAALEALAARLRARMAETVPGHLRMLPATPVAFLDGHALLQRDPTVRAERALHAALDAAMLMSLRRRNRVEDERAQDLDEIMREGRVETLYQPILDLRDLTLVGHEVFSRGPAGSPFESAETLFALAERTGRLLDFERVCRAQAFSSARRHLRAGIKLFINTSAAALLDPELAGEAFAEHARTYGLEPTDVVLEIAERVAVEERAASSAALRDLKRCGFRLAIDDMGAGYASLHSVVEMEPDFTKFDVALVRHIDRSLIKQSLLETLVELSNKIGAQVIAEGIESESELIALRDLGVFLGRGRYLAAPAPLPPAGIAAS
jgi:EAL domain-containing protein (putative c-di-GMP-specific phosphodiesterase class I)/GGDEF domain-containing protein